MIKYIKKYEKLLEDGQIDQCELRHYDDDNIMLKGSFGRLIFEFKEDNLGNALKYLEEKGYAPHAEKA